MEVYKDCEKSPSGKNKYQNLDISDCLPFFACPNQIFCENSLKDIKRYNYCKESSTQPYKGDYGDQPKLWIDKYFLLRNLANLIETRQIERSTKAAKNKGVPLDGNV